MKDTFMKAMVLKAPGDLALDDVARPTPGPSQVLIRVSHSGVCGTDLKIFNGAIRVQCPRIMGHEIVGEVVESSSGALRPGSRVIVDPQLFCGSCFHCRIDQTHLCPKGMLLGRDTNGGFAEFVTAPSSHVFPLPDSLGGRTAPLVQVLTTCLHAQRLSKIFPGDSVVVLGLGVTGQLHVQLAKARGAKPVIGITRSAAKRELAEQVGANLTFATTEGAIQKVIDATEGRGADLLIDTTGEIASLSAAIHMARSGGRLLLFGIITATEGALPFYQLYFKELAVINARVAKTEDFPESIKLVEQGVVRLEPLVSHVLPLAELNHAIALLGSSSGERMKIILEHG
jgi:2-desacetyl-2-hydroxyethyl bacteriochlorophyllide A dehydrogenase